jgi:hypothetical protein
MRRFDAVAMFGSLWLLASMLVDAVTPKELTVYMIGAAIAPTAVVSAIFYSLSMPPMDFALIFATLWMISAMVLELITPQPLSPLMAAAALAPMLIVGCVVNFLYWPWPQRWSATRSPKEPVAR